MFPQCFPTGKNVSCVEILGTMCPQQMFLATCFLVLPGLNSVLQLKKSNKRKAKKKKTYNSPWRLERNQRILFFFFFFFFFCIYKKKEEKKKLKTKARHWYCNTLMLSTWNQRSRNWSDHFIMYDSCFNLWIWGRPTFRS